MRKRPLIALQRSFRRLSQLLGKGRQKTRLARLEERHASVRPYLEEADIVEQGGQLKPKRRWSKEPLRHIRLRDGTYLLRSNLEPLETELLWRQYIQLTDVEEAFRCLKSELSIRPIWHHSQDRVEAHIMIAFLGYCLWALLKQKLRQIAGSITPARALESLGGIFMVEVWFDLRDRRKLCLPRITQPEKEQALIFHHLRWTLPEQPPQLTPEM